MLYVVLILVGVGIGVILTTVRIHTNTVGTIIVDQSDPTDNPYLFLKPSANIHNIRKMDYVILRVEEKDFISHH